MKSVGCLTLALGLAVTGYALFGGPALGEAQAVMAQPKTEARLPAAAVDVSGLVEGGNRFALDLYRQLRAKDGNLFFSPSSISTALAMAYAGAAAETKAEMAKTLYFRTPSAQLHDQMKTLQALWTTPSEKTGIRLNLANRLWGQQSQAFLPTFLRITREKYGAELARLNFARRVEAAKTINSWVEDQTEGKITQVIPASALGPKTKLVLTNAVYFHGNWAEPFNKHMTEDKDFHLTATDKIEVAMMHRRDEVRYGAIDDLQVLELRYGDGSLSMIFLLPKKIDGIADLEAKLTIQNLRRWTASVRPREVTVYLPKFKTNTQFELSGTLGAMGMASAFDTEAADFSGMTGGKDFSISSVMHKAFVDVNEEGTEAAAATGVTIVSEAARKESLVFRADHPFVFMIRDNRNGAILFLGRMTNPYA